MSQGNLQGFVVITGGNQVLTYEEIAADPLLAIFRHPFYTSYLEGKHGVNGLLNSVVQVSDLLDTLSDRGYSVATVVTPFFTDGRLIGEPEGTAWMVSTEDEDDYLVSELEHTQGYAAVSFDGDISVKAKISIGSYVGTTPCPGINLAERLGLKKAQPQIAPEPWEVPQPVAPWPSQPKFEVPPYQEPKKKPMAGTAENPFQDERKPAGASGGQSKPTTSDVHLHKQMFGMF